MSDPAVAPRLLAKLARSAIARLIRSGECQPDTLTERKLDVLRLAARGQTNKQLGAALQISDRNVQNQLTHTCAPREEPIERASSSRAQLAEVADEHGALAGCAPASLVAGLVGDDHADVDQDVVEVQIWLPLILASWLRV